MSVKDKLAEIIKSQSELPALVANFLSKGLKNFFSVYFPGARSVHARLARSGRNVANNVKEVVVEV
jgi:hypothetical protein